VQEAFKQVTEFRRAYGVAASVRLPADVQALRNELIREEFAEYQRAAQNGDLVGIADALADLAYVVIGTAVAHGLTQFPEIFEVHRSNMSQLGSDGRPIIREDGKVLKGDRYSPPDLAPLIEGAP
jgi:predicted HAD superfamily Cof-like phosphohydrolase